MDTTLERILSLLPRKPDGRIQHGAKAEMARKLGFQDGTIVSMWENGRSKSYTGYLYEIAKLYDVSVEWLRGDSDIRQTAPAAVSSLDAAVLEFVHSLPPDKLRGILLLLGAPAELLDALDREAHQG